MAELAPRTWHHSAPCVGTDERCLEGFQRGHAPGVAFSSGIATYYRVGRLISLEDDARLDWGRCLQLANKVTHLRPEAGSDASSIGAAHALSFGLRDAYSHIANGRSVRRSVRQHRRISDDGQRPT